MRNYSLRPPMSQKALLYSKKVGVSNVTRLVCRVTSSAALSGIGSRLTSKQLFLAIIKPSETISLGYESTSILSEDGNLYTGFITSESKETLTLRIPGGLQKTIAQDHIDLRKRSKTSLMPVGIDTVLTPKELVDLVGWLKTQRAVNSDD